MPPPGIAEALIAILGAVTALIGLRAAARAVGRRGRSSTREGRGPRVDLEELDRQAWDEDGRWDDERAERR